MNPGTPDRTQVGIIGAGPAGLVLAHLLHLRGIDSVVLEARSRAHCEQRIRAGVLEDGTASFLTEIGIGDRMRRMGVVHRGVVFRLDGEDHRIALSELTGGRRITIYGQEELIKDLIAARVSTKRALLFETEVLGLEDIDGSQPKVVYHDGRVRRELRCDLVAGCDGFHGPSRKAARPAVYSREYPLAWLGILADVRPTIDEIVYSSHERGFALHSVRSPFLSRLHLQCLPDEDLSRWSEERIWDELDVRLATTDGQSLTRGPILKKAVIPLRSFVAEPMRRGRLFLAGDAAHIVPPTGAKGLNLAITDVRVLAEAIGDWYDSNDSGLLDAYSTTCLRHVWQVESFSSWMTLMLHRFPGQDQFDRRLQRAQLEHACSSSSAATSLAESYLGLDRETAPAA